MIFKSLEEIGNDRVCKALTGLTKDQFKQVLNAFELSHQSVQKEQYEQRLKSRPQRLSRMPAGGPRGYLSTLEQKLFFVLYYLKNYPTYDVLGYLFGFSGGHAYDHMQCLLPVLQHSLAALKLLPERGFENVAELEQLIEKEKKIIVDGVERPCARPQDDDEQRARYSGKKKRHTVKNLIMTDHHRRVIYLSPMANGSMHDYTLFKQEFPPDFSWFEKIQIWLDLGFYGAHTEYTHATQIYLPHKKPRKSKANPSPVLSPEQKEDNKKLAQVRVKVEHAIGLTKSFHCLAHRVRNHLDSLLDTFMWLGAGLQNLKTSSVTIS
jgi:DDE superfamily endonuclease